MTQSMHSSVVDLVAVMRRSGEFLHSPASLAPDGKLTPAGEVALGQLQDAIAELLSADVAAKGVEDMQALVIYAQARTTFGLKALGEADFGLTENHMNALLVLLDKLSGCLAHLTGISPEQVGQQTLN